jgi:hypothetical protein
MSQPDPEAMNLGDEIASKEGAAKGYGILILLSWAVFDNLIAFLSRMDR